MKFEAGDTLEFEDGKRYTFPKTGNYTFKGKVFKYNGTDLNIDWSGVASNEEETVSKAIDELKKRMST
jgi:hypothetical protein